MNAISRYDQACAALAEARTTDDLRQIINKAEAVKQYAKRAQNRYLEIDAREIRHRAEHKFGQLLSELRANGQLIEGRPKKKTLNSQVGFRLTLADLGATYNFSSKCQRLAEIAADKFEVMLATWRERALADDGPAAFDLLSIQKAERRARREAQLGAKQLALPKKKYGVIVADPEWKFEVWSPNGLDRSAENHYPTSPTKVIADRDVISIAADDCVLGLWTTVPMLMAARDVLESWGFTYKTNFVWVKDRIGPGYWNRNKHEHFLICTRGEVPCPAPGEQWDSVIEAPRRGHSTKPTVFLEMMEQYFPTLPKIELNCRGPARPGWSSWGLEAAPADNGHLAAAS